MESVSRAASRFGVHEVVSTALCIGVFDLFQPGKTDPPSPHFLQSSWHHGLQCGVLALLIAQEIDYERPVEAFVAGFLHDVGKLVLAMCQPDAYETLLRVTGDIEEILSYEEGHMGGTHPDTGAWMAARWGFSPFVADAIRYHHESRERVFGALPLVRVVYAAHDLCRRRAFEDSEQSSAAESFFHLSSAATEGLLARSEPIVKTVASALDMEGASLPGERPSAEASRRGGKNGFSPSSRGLDSLADALDGMTCAGTPDEVYAAFQRGLDRVFGLKRYVFFLEESHPGVLLAAHCRLEIRRFPGSDLVVPLDVSNSLPVRSFRDRATLDSFSAESIESLALLDEQILHLLGTEGFLCLPFQGVNDAPLGTVVLGVEEAQLYKLTRYFRPLQTLLRQAGFALYALQLRSDSDIPRQAERLHVLDTAARRVLHEANGPLGIIKNYLKILDLKLNEHDLAQDEIRIINEEIDRVAQILERLRTLTNEVPQKMGPVDVNALISDLTRIMKDSLLRDAGVRLHLDLDPKTPLALGERNSLKQIFINLIQNAVEAMKAGGNLTLRTTPPDDSSKHPVPDGRTDDRGKVQITVSDDGPGIPDHVRPHLFEPVQGTKGGGHAGLGLSIVHHLVITMGGRITYADNEAGGADFIVFLPACAQDRHSAAPSAEE